MALKAWASFPEDSEIVAVVNRKLEGVEYPDHIHYIENDENCLAKAWNIGLRHLFDNGHKEVFVSGLDSLCPDSSELDRVLGHDGLGVGIIGFRAEGMPIIGGDYQPIQHGDGSFSFFLISKDCFNFVGRFDQRYKPAYFEDNDYLERLWDSGYKPLRNNGGSYFHIFQGTMKHGTDSKRNYPDYMQKNLELFVEDYGKVPDHLPSDIKFK